jgi:hypothetical protein
LQQFRCETLLIFHNPVTKRARHAAKRHNPGEAGATQAKLARRARSVRIFHRLISQGIVKNLELHFFHAL